MYFLKRFGYIIFVLIAAVFLFITASFAMDDSSSDTSQKQNLRNSSLMKSLSDLWLNVCGSPRTPSPKQEGVKGERGSIEYDSNTEYTNEVFIDSEEGSPRNMSGDTYISFLSADITLVNPRDLSKALLDQQYIKDDDQLSRSSSGSEELFATVLSQGRFSWVLSSGKTKLEEIFEEDKFDCCCCSWFSSVGLFSHS